MQNELSIVKVIVKHLKKDVLRDDEKEFLDDWICQSAKHKELLDRLGNEELLSSDLLSLVAEDKEEARKIIYEKLFPEIQRIERRSIKNWPKYVAAASILLLLAEGTYIGVVQNKHGKQEIHSVSAPVQVRGDLHFGGDSGPGKYKALLKLANGLTITLDSTVSGLLTQQGNTSVLNKNGKLVYEGNGTSNTGEIPAMYNTLTTAKGETYSLTLADGSRVWLNSASSLTFPVAFNGKQRMVEITGEAYFEVAKIPAPGGGGRTRSIPFIVKARGMRVEVTGTAFNINAYEDEAAIKTTLLEGAVKVSFSSLDEGARKALDERDQKEQNEGLREEARGPEVKLKPGEQAQCRGKNIRVATGIDVEPVVAWKNGTFYFKDENLEAIMRQLANWYDMDVIYESRQPGRHFGGMISRNTQLSQVLKMLELSDVHFRVEGKKLIVL